MKSLLEKGTKCLLVQPQFSALSFWSYPEVCNIVGAKYPTPSLALLTVAALLPQQWEFKLVDSNVEPLLDDHLAWADIVCTGGMLPQQRSTLSIIEKAHANHCLVAVGGCDATSQPAIYQSADFIVRGEGEITIPMLFNDLERGSMSGEYRSEQRADMTRSVVPRFDLVNFRNYLYVGIQFSRGCPFNCEFCDIIELFGRLPRTKTAGHVMKELQTLYDLGYRGQVDFVDDNFIGNKRNLKDMLPAIKEWSQHHQYPFFFSTQVSVNLADDDELLKMMSDIDFRYVFIGFETPEDEILELTHKKLNCARNTVELVKKIYSYGIVVNAGYILGFDRENALSHEKIKKSIHDSGVVMVMFGMLYALPNTQLARRLKKEGRLFGDYSTLSVKGTEIDQTTADPNYVPNRSILEILRDYVSVIQCIYDPREYYRRITYTALNLRVNNKYKPSFSRLLLHMTAFMKICLRAGFSRTTGLHYWRMILTVLLRNPRAMEPAVNLAAMFIHFYRHTVFNIGLRTEKIRYIEECGEGEYNAQMFASFQAAHSSHTLHSMSRSTVNEKPPEGQPEQEIHGYQGD